MTLKLHILFPFFIQVSLPDAPSPASEEQPEEEEEEKNKSCESSNCGILELTADSLKDFEDLPCTDLSNNSLDNETNYDQVPIGKRVLEDSSSPALKKPRCSSPQSPHKESSCISPQKQSKQPSSRSSDKDQKQSENVQALLQQHGKTTVCVC